MARRKRDPEAQPDVLAGDDMPPEATECAPVLVAAHAGLHSRADAGLAAPRRPAARLHRREGLVVHCTDGSRPQAQADVRSVVRAIQRYHMAPPRWVPALDEHGKPRVKPDGTPRMKNEGGRGWPDGGYHWVVDPWGGIWQMRGWGVIGAHAKTGGHNLKSHGIVLLGDGTEMTDAERQALLWLMDDADRRFGRGFVRGHRDIPGVSKSCPGDVVAAFVHSLARC